MASQCHTTRRSSTDNGRSCKAEVRLLSQVKANLESQTQPFNQAQRDYHCPNIKDGSERARASRSQTRRETRGRERKPSSSPSYMISTMFDRCTVFENQRCSCVDDKVALATDKHVCHVTC